MDLSLVCDVSYIFCYFLYCVRKFDYHHAHHVGVGTCPTTGITRQMLQASWGESLIAPLHVLI